MYRVGVTILGVVLCAVFLQSTASAQRAGQSLTVRTGTVTGMKSVDLNDGNALRGALVGGAFGSALTRSSKSSGRRDRNAAIGAVLGASAAASKTRPGRVYTVTMTDGSMIQIATEQTEIRVDDCVHIEQTGNSANIRRAPSAACAPDMQEMLGDPEIVEELQEEAAECAAAKQELVDADTDAAVERAIRKIQLLCYD